MVISPPSKFRSQLDIVVANGRIWTYALFAFMAAVCLYKAHRFHYNNFIFTYPFISYDGYQWMSDGLHYLDRQIDATHRNPGLPIIFAVLKSLGLVDFFPYVISALTLSFYGASYWLVRAFTSPAVTRLTILWFFFVFRIHNFFDFILSDPWCLILMTLGLGFLVRVRYSSRMLLGAAASFGLALNFQFAPVFAAPALAWYVLRGVGVKNLLENRKITYWSVGLFLALVLPQFLYKWIAFGSPLYSHVIHFPLLRIHLFGLPFYAVNLFAFLGWPLACVMLFGFKRVFFSRDNDWQLIHLYGLCMFLFWIVTYLWLDVRFLLYLVPAWMVYAAKGIDALDLKNWLSFRSKTPIHRAAIVAAIYFGISLAAIKVVAFESNLLPITPQMSLRFSSTPISSWGVATITTDKITTEHSDSYESLFNLSGHFKFYRRFARAPHPHSDEFVKDVEIVADFLKTASTNADRIGLCGDLWKVFETKMRIFYTIERNVGDCSNTNKIYLLTKGDEKVTLANNKNYREIWRGSELILLKEEKF